jgi:hypothetical protein
MNADTVRAALAAELAPDARAWLDDATARIRSDPGALAALLPAAGRHVGRGPLPADAAELAGWTVDDAARTLLLAALPLADDALAAEVATAYRHGDAAERRGILRALPLLELGDRGLPVVREALRTSDDRLIAAALGPYAARHLEASMWRQAVLKCVFNGIPLASVAGLDDRADAELARMLADYAHERVAAGRDVPTDVWPVIDRFEGALEASGLLDELRSDVPDRRAAAERALDHRRAATAGRP